MTTLSLGGRLKTLKPLIAADALREALSVLNSWTDFRFSGLYIYAPPALSNRFLIDRLNPEVESAEDVPLDTTYCLYTGRQRKPLQIQDAPRDHRWVGHPSRDVVQAYCGMPLVDAKGEAFGTVCHFDLEPRHIDDLDVQTLEHLGPLLSQCPSVLAR